MRRGRETELAQEIQKLVFTDADQLRHEESMNMAQQQAAIVSPPPWSGTEGKGRWCCHINPLTWMRGTVEDEPCVRARTTFLWRAEITVPISGGKPSGRVNDMEEQDHASA